MNPENLTSLCRWSGSLTQFSGLLSVIVKWGDDLRQELLCSQLLEQFRVSVRVV